MGLGLSLTSDYIIMLFVEKVKSIRRILVYKIYIPLYYNSNRPKLYSIGKSAPKFLCPNGVVYPL